MEFADTPIIALRHGVRTDQELAAIELLEREGPWLRRHEVAQHITVTVPCDGHYDDDSSTAVIDWDNIVQSLDGMASTPNIHERANRAILAVACSMARGHKIDLGEVAITLRHRADLAAWVVSAILYAAGHLDHVVRWPKKPALPSYVRIVDCLGKVIQEAGQASGEDQWHETGPRHLIGGDR